MKTFALIGGAGFVAPRHMKAIQNSGSQLVAVVDPNDSIGIIDSYFPDAQFFTEFERFDRYIDKLRGQGNPIDFVSICSPNYLHDAHCRWALRNGADVICEKPLVLNPWNLEALQGVEEQTGKSIYNLLQLRVHPEIVALKARIDNSSPEQFHDIDLRYITPRGAWYNSSWKGDVSKSGGITTNIGFHLFDLLVWLFGEVLESRVEELNHTSGAGKLRFDRAEVQWYLSIKKTDLPEECLSQGLTSHRIMMINDKKIEFSKGFTDLHTKVYQDVLAGRGFRSQEVSRAIQLMHDIRNNYNILR